MAVEQAIASQHSTEMFSMNIANDRGQSEMRAEIRFSSPQPPSAVIAFADKYQLKVEQLQANFPGVGGELKAGYIIQPGQTLEAAVERFTELQAPFFHSKLTRLEEEWAAETDPARKEARTRQVARIRSYQQAFEQNGVAVSALVVHGPTTTLQAIQEDASLGASLSVSAR